MTVKWTSAAARIAVAALVACAITPAVAQAQVAVPTVSAFFAQAQASPGQPVGLGFTVTNKDGALSLTGVAFSVALPAGLVVATPSGLFTTCDGTATAAGSAIDLSGTTLAPSGDDGDSCLVIVNVVAASTGVVQVASGPATSVESGPGAPSNTATLTVVAGPPPPPPVDPPTVAEAFATSPIRVGESTRVTFTLTNPNATATLYSVAFDDALPAGLRVAASPNFAETCASDGVRADPGAARISLLGLQIDGAAQCSFSVDVTGTAATISPNPTSQVFYAYDPGSGDFVGSVGPGASATLVVIAPPALTAAFAPATVAPGVTSTLTFALANTNPALTLTGVGFTDPLPAGLAVATPSGLSGLCGGGTITAAAGSGSIALAGATLGPATTCTFSVGVTPSSLGAKATTTSTVSSNEAGSGPAATATLQVALPPVLGLGPPPPPPPPPPVAPRLPSNRFKVTRFRTTPGGIVRFDVSVAGAGDVIVLATLGASTRTRKPGPGRFTVARKTAHAKRAGTLHIKLLPNAIGRSVIRRAHRPQRINVWTSFRPTGGRAGAAVFKTVLLRPR
jgi:hypothetical protein